MKWIMKPKPNVGDERIIEKFLLFPRCLNREWRWFERVRIKQVYDRNPWSDSRGEDNCWVNKDWA
jgi:hypothetical protein